MVASLSLAVKGMTLQIMITVMPDFMITICGYLVHIPLSTSLWDNARVIAIMMMNVGMVSIACSELVANLSLAVKGMTLELIITVMPDFTITICGYLVNIPLTTCLWDNVKVIAIMMMNVGMVSIACSDLMANLSLAVKGMTLELMITVMPDFMITICGYLVKLPLTTCLWDNARVIVIMMMNVGMVSIACSEMVASLSLAVKGMTLQIMITVMPDFKITICGYLVNIPLSTSLWDNARVIAIMMMNVGMVSIACSELVANLSLAVKGMTLHIMITVMPDLMITICGYLVNIPLSTCLWYNVRVIAIMMMNVRMVSIACSEIMANLSLVVKGMSLQNLITV